MSEPTAADQFADFEQEVRASHLGMWLFLASELLLFAALFALYAAYRAHYPSAFAFGISHASKVLGTCNTALLICSSYMAAEAVHAIRKGRGTVAGWLLGLTVLCGAGFLALKGVEYASHIREGFVPGGGKLAQRPDAAPGLAPFFTIYFLTTGLHAIHIIVGMAVLSWMMMRAFLHRLAPPHTHPLVLGVLYWHLVDVIWIFLWPLFYLLPGSGS